MKQFFRNVFARGRQSLPRNSHRLEASIGMNRSADDLGKVNEAHFLERISRAKRLEKHGKLDSALEVLEAVASRYSHIPDFSAELASLQEKNGFVVEARDTYYS